MTDQPHPQKIWHIYFKDGTRLSYENAFAFYLAKNHFASETVDHFAVEEEWVDVQKEFMMAVERHQQEHKNE